MGKGYLETNLRELVLPCYLSTSNPSASLFMHLESNFLLTWDWEERRKEIRHPKTKKFNEYRLIDIRTWITTGVFVPVNYTLLLGLKKFGRNRISYILEREGIDFSIGSEDIFRTADSFESLKNNLSLQDNTFYYPVELNTEFLEGRPFIEGLTFPLVQDILIFVSEYYRNLRLSKKETKNWKEYLQNDD